MKEVLIFRLPVLAIAFFISSCAGFNEAYEDRVCWDGISAIPLQCNQAFMHFRCPEDLESLSGPSITASKKVVIKPVAGYSAPKVGELFSHHGSIPIFIKGDSPWNTLHDDVVQVLRHLGYEVRNNPDGSESVIEADMTLLDVHSDPGGWFDLKGTTLATASFKVIMQNSNGEELWTEEFTGKQQIKVSYFFLKDAEKTLGQAYCRALEDFAHAARTPEFQDRVR